MLNGKGLTDPVNLGNHVQIDGYVATDADQHVNIEWSEVAAELPQRLREAGRLAAVLSPHLTVEEAYLLAKLVRREASSDACLGGVPAKLTADRRS